MQTDSVCVKNTELHTGMNVYVKYIVTKPKIAVLSLGVAIRRLMEDMKKKKSLTFFQRQLNLLQHEVGEAYHLASWVWDFALKLLQNIILGIYRPGNFQVIDKVCSFISVLFAYGWQRKLRVQENNWRYSWIWILVMNWTATETDDYRKCVEWQTLYNKTTQLVF